MKRHSAAILLCLTCIPSLAVSQTLRPASPMVAPYRGAQNSESGAWLSTGTIKTLGAGVILTAWALRYDARAQEEFTEEGWWSGAVVDAGDVYGHGLNLAGLSAAVYGVGTVFGDSTLRHTARTMALGLAVDGALVTGLKLATRRRRPDGGDLRSFPSGHTSGAFTISTIIQRRHGWRIGIPAYAIATLTAFARMEDNRHYASDVIAGACIGIAIGRILTPSGGHIRPALHLGPDGTQVGMVLDF